MSEEKVFSVGVYYSGSYHVDVQAENKVEAKNIAIELLRDEADIGFSVEYVEVFEIGE